MSNSVITRISHSEALKAKSETNWAEVLAMPVEDGEADDFDWSKAVMVEPIGKATLSIRLDAEILAFFKRGGKGYQTRINAVLRSYVKAKQKGA